MKSFIALVLLTLTTLAQANFCQLHFDSLQWALASSQNELNVRDAGLKKGYIIHSKFAPLYEGTGFELLNVGDFYITGVFTQWSRLDWRPKYHVRGEMRREVISKKTSATTFLDVTNVSYRVPNVPTYRGGEANYQTALNIVKKLPKCKKLSARTAYLEKISVPQI